VQDLSEMAGGALTGIIFNISMYPADVIKARMATTDPAAGGVLQTTVALFRTSGFASFYRGVGPRVLRAMATNAAGFWIWHRGKEMVADDDV
jgi:hypothetical protein